MKQILTVYGALRLGKQAGECQETVYQNHSLYLL
jgi:hypothetical protein